ncbi:MAG: hypothetical protein GY756_06090 [bacterium]|nr:hypothetical protein [bacterium]
MPVEDIGMIYIYFQMADKAMNSNNNKLLNGVVAKLISICPVTIELMNKE